MIKNERKILIFIFTIFISLSLCIRYFSEGNGIGGEDGYTHFFISQYAFYKPSLLLNLFGRPLFTLFSAPLAQFGFFGMQLFNILCISITSYLTYTTAKFMHQRYPIIALLTVLLMPYPFISMFSGLTEPFSALLLILVLFLLVKSRYVALASLLSFLPFARPEYIFLVIIIQILFLIQKKYYLLPFTIIGVLLFQSIGTIYYKDFLWLIHSNPNLTNVSKYIDRGSLTFYFDNFVHYSNPVLMILIILGLIHFSFEFIKRRSVRYFVILIFPIITIIFFSLSQYYGYFGAYRFLRYLIPLTPIFALYAASGFEWIATKKSSTFQLFLSILVISLTIYWLGNPPDDYNIPYTHFISETFTLIIFFILFTIIKKLSISQRVKNLMCVMVIVIISIWYIPYYFPLPLKINSEQQLIKKAVEWIKESNLTDRKMYYFYPYMMYLFKHNPYDKKHYQPIGAIKYNSVEKDALIIWDAHFSPNEEKIPLNFLNNNPSFTLLKSFKPKSYQPTENFQAFEVYLFTKI